MLQFRIQGTPNPNARKYVLNKELKAHGKVSYKTEDDCAHVPLGVALLHIHGVSQIHFFENVLTLTQDGSQDWMSLDAKIQETVAKHIDLHDIYFEDFSKQKAGEKKGRGSPNWTEELEKIDQILDEMIRPSLQFDGGDIELIEFSDKILTLRYMGACGGCPSSMSGTLEAIKGIVRDELHDESIEVVAI
ncbi:MAG: NifU family protein [Oligoflexales bacterium]|nr:NifU family protein [Oligoflexales bacterium]